MVLENSGDQPSIIIGRVSSLCGLRGGIKVISYTRPQDNLFTYHPWLLGNNGGWQEHRLQRYESRGRQRIAFLIGIDNRDSAATLVNLDIAIYRHQLPVLPAEESYWCDLLGMQVRNQDGLSLGTIVDILETGCNGVLVISGEERILLPLIKGDIITRVDQDARIMHVQWSPGYQ